MGNAGSGAAGVANVMGGETSTIGGGDTYPGPGGVGRPPGAGGGSAGSDVGDMGGHPGAGGDSAFSGGTAGVQPRAGASGQGIQGGAGGGSAAECPAGGELPRVCTAECPCGAGEGSCSANDQCEASLSCVGGAARKFGFSGNTCLADHCANNTVDGDETSQDCGGSCGCLATFERLEIEGTFPRIAAVSGNGLVVVGAHDGKAFRWTRASGLTYLETPPGTRAATAYDVSFDGDVVVGSTYCESGCTQLATRWERGVASTVDPGEFSYSYWFHVASDGSQMLGANGAPRVEASIWSEGALPDGMLDAKALSRDARIIVGETAEGALALWSADAGLSVVAAAQSDWSNWGGLAISADGERVAGYAYFPFTGGYEYAPYLWSLADGYTMLGRTELGELSTIPSDLSEDGLTVIGRASPAVGDPAAFIWDESRGMRTLRQELENRGLEFPGDPRIVEAVSVSADGSVIVGSGVTDANSSYYWIARLLGPVPP